MWIKDLEIIGDNLTGFKINRKGGDFLSYADRIPQKPENLFAQPYKEFFMVANFAGGGWVTLLNDRAIEILNLIDGQRSIKEIYERHAKISQKFYGFQDASLIFKNKISLKDIYNKYLFDRPLINFEDFAFFFQLLEKSRLINFSDGTTKNTFEKKALNVWLHLTNQCNFACSYCYISKTPHSLTDECAFLTIDKIFASAHKNGIKKITLRFSGGEPLLEFPKIKKIINYVNEKYKEEIKSKIDFSTTVLTNAFLIDSEIIKFVKENQINLSVSLDGIGEFHNRQRISASGEKNFETVKRNIEMIVREKIPLKIIAVVTRLNLLGLPALVDWFISNQLRFGLSFIRKNPLIDWNLIPKNEEIINIISPIFDKFILKPPRYLFGSSFVNFVPRRYGQFWKGSCGVGKGFAPIDENGDIYPCHMAFSQPDLKLGSIHDDGIDLYSLVKSSKASAFNPGIKEKKGCQDCQWLYICSSPCPMSNFFAKGDASSSSYYCPTYKALIPKALELEAARLIRCKR